MSKKIFFQKCNFNIIYYIFYLIAGVIDTTIKYNYYPIAFVQNKEKDAKYYLSFSILRLYVSNISDFLSIIPYFIRKKKLKNNKENEKSQIADLNNEDEKQNESNQLIYNDVKELQSGKRKKLIIINSVIISILDFLFYFFLCLYYIIFDDNTISYNDFNCFGPLYNIFQFVSSYLILKTHFYKLQYFSLFLSIGLFIIIFIFDLIIIIKYQEKIDRITYLFQPIRYLFNVLNILQFQNDSIFANNKCNYLSKTMSVLNRLCFVVNPLDLTPIYIVQQTVPTFMSCPRITWT